MLMILTKLLFCGGFSFPYAGYLCVACSHKFSSSVKKWASGSLKSVFDRAYAIQTRPRFNVPSERCGITFKPKWHTRSTPALAEILTVPSLGIELRTFGMLGALTTAESWMFNYYLPHDVIIIYNSFSSPLKFSHILTVTVAKFIFLPLIFLNNIIIYLVLFSFILVKIVPCFLFYFVIPILPA